MTAFASRGARSRSGGLAPLHLRAIAYLGLALSNACLLSIDESRIDGSGGGSSTGGSGGATSQGGESSGGNAPTNRFLNPSFEDWTGMDLLVWQTRNDEPLVRSEEAKDGSFSVQIELPNEFGGIRQAVDFPTPIAPGSTITVSFWSKFISGSNELGSASYSIAFADGTPTDYSGYDVTFAGEWALHQDEFVYEHPVESVELLIGSGAATGQVILVDDARLEITP